ncbi:hypothetical protein HIW39_000179 [Campylobacter coli]|nr:hypothetical protein [Campylobacter coli]
MFRSDLQRFSPFLNFFMVKCPSIKSSVIYSFSPFLNFFMVKSWRYYGKFS